MLYFPIQLIPLARVTVRRHRNLLLWDCCVQYQYAVVFTLIYLHISNKGSRIQGKAIHNVEVGSVEVTEVTISISKEGRWEL